MRKRYVKNITKVKSIKFQVIYFKNIREMIIHGIMYVSNIVNGCRIMKQSSKFDKE